MERFQARICQHLEEPGAAGFVGRMKFLDGRIEVAERHMDGRGEGAHQEALAAEPLQPFQSGARLGGASRAGQRIGVRRDGRIEKGNALRQFLGNLLGALRLSVIGENQRSVEAGKFMFGKEVESDLNLPQAFACLTIQMERPSQAAL